MTAAILEYENQSGKQRVNVRLGQSLLIGASNSSDIQLDESSHVAPLHCEITFASGTLAIKDLTKGKRPLLVNGKSVKRQRLSDGDQFDIGQNKFRVVLKEEQAAESAAPVAASAAVAAGAVAATQTTEEEKPSNPKMAFPVDEPAEVQTENHSAEPAPEPAEETADAEESTPEEKFLILENGLKRYLLDSAFEELIPKLKNAESDWKFAMLVNRSKVKSPPEDAKDLLEAFDDEFTDGQQLNLVTSDDADDFWKKYVVYWEDKAAILLASQSEAGPQEDDLAPNAGWFLTPSRLNFNLENGTESLLNTLFSLSELMVIPRDQDGDVCYIFEATVTDESTLLGWINGTVE